MSSPHLPQRLSDEFIPADRTVDQDTRADRPRESVLQAAMQTAFLLWRNKLVVLACVGAVLALAVIQIRRAQPAYQATAVVRLVDKNRQLSGPLGSDAGQRLMGSSTDPVLEQIQVLQSRAVASEVVAREGLQLVPETRGFERRWLNDVQVAPDAAGGRLALEFTPSKVIVSSGTRSTSVAYGAPVEAAGVRFVVPERPPVAAAEFRIVPLETAASMLQRKLHGDARERTGIIDISYLGGDPVSAQRVTNTAAAVFQLVNARMEKQQSVRRREFIEQQLGKVETQLAEAQAAHNRFRSREQVYSSQQKLESQQSDLSSIELRRQELDADRRTYVALLTAIERAGGSAGSGERLAALVSSPGVVSNPVVSQLYGQLLQYQLARDSLTTGQWASAGSNPDVKRLDALIAATEPKVLAAVRGQIGSLDARIEALDGLRRRTAGELSVLPTTEAEESRLLAQVETYRKEAERLREELQRAQIEEAAEAGQVDIVDLAALPTLPVGTGRGPKLFLALILGLALGAGVSYVRENYRTVIRLKEDLEGVTQAPNLALVPRIRPAEVPALRVIGWRRLGSGNGNGGGTDVSNTVVARNELVTVHDSRSPGAEAYRTLRTNLLFSATITGLKRMIVTSSGPQEGKSTTAANLAAALAQQGQSVLLVDCDLRRPRAHEIFLAAQTPGLSNVLLGQLPPSEAVQPTGIEGLQVLTAGVIPPNPAELLGSPQMRRLLDQLDGMCDIVILDTPPVLAASDAAILSRVSDGTIVVVRAGHTHRAALRDTLHQLSVVGARVLGTVLNDPDAEAQKHQAYYGTYFNKYYGYASSGS